MKNKLSKGLSLSVNPKHSISERFKASTHGFCHFWKKFESERNTPFSVILGFIPRIHTKHSPLDTRVKLEYDRDLMVDTRDRLSVTPEYDNRRRMCFKPENDHKRSLTKGLDVVCQCASLLERLKTHIKINSLFCHPRAWLLARPEDLDSRVKPENDHNNLLPQCAPDATGFLSDVYKRSTRARKFLVDGVQCGRSMIEMLGVLAIIGVLSVGGIAGYSKAMETYKINKLKQAITEIVANTRTLYASQNPQNKYKSLDYSTAKNAGILTVDLHNSDIYPSLFGNYYNSYKTFVIKLDWISEKECVALATADWGTTSSTGFYSLAIYDYSQLYGEGINCETTGENNFGSGNKMYVACSGQLPLSPAIAAKYCALNSAKGFDVNQGHSSFISLQFQ